MADGQILPLLIEEEMKESYLTYALSVIKSRALPDIRDGLKPSQRRILVAMNDLNLGPTAKFRKCAKIAGDTSGNYHPHGESVVYPTMVRLAQDWVMRYPLVIPQGNFGSPDGDPPAAMRYTEARMSRIAMELLEDLDKDTVDHVRNYDDSRDEPTVLPGKFPNLLCNGSSGIAVGMATSIPPHNLTEICDGLTALIDDPEIDVAGLMQYVLGPDFPTGAEICGRLGIRRAYETGKGKIRVRAIFHVEDIKTRQQLVIDQLPYQINKTNLLEEIARLVTSGKITGISDVRDESGRKEKVRIVIELRRGEDPDVIQNLLFKHTTLQSTYSLILMAISEERPHTCSLKQLLQSYLDHRFVVIRRRTAFLLARAEARAHIVAGLLKALDIIDQVIETIRGSHEVPEAKANLVAKFDFSEIQADAILRMTLARLTGLEREKLEAEMAELNAKIADYKDILARDERVYGIIKDDLAYLRERYGDVRRTIIGAEAADLEIEDLIVDEKVVVTITHEGYIKRNATSDYRAQKRGGKGVSGAGMKEGDFIESLFIASTHQYIMFFSSLGRVYWKKVYSLPDVGRTSRGRSLVNLINLTDEESVSSVIPVRKFDEEDAFLIFATRKGVVKKTPLADYGNVRATGIRAIKLDDDDALIRVLICRAGDQIVLGTAQGMSIRFNSADARPMGRVTRGVTGIRLNPGDEVVDMTVIDESMTLLTVTANGYGKRSGFAHYRLQSRGGKGIINLKTTPKTGAVVGMRSVSDTDELMLITSAGQVVRTTVGELRIIGRATQGVRVITPNEGDVLVSVARLVDEAAVDDEAGEDDETGGDAETGGNDDTRGDETGGNDETGENDETGPADAAGAQE